MKKENQIVGLELEKQVTSLEPSKELKELGVKQDSLWYWIWVEWNEKTEWVLIPRDRAIKVKKDKFSAFTVAELGKMLPIWVTTEKNDEDEFLVRSEDSVYITWDNTEANARAKMLIYLIENKLMEV